MSYKVNRSLGYQPAYVMNPWVFANYGQPQRLRGQVSPMVAQTTPPYLTNWHLGAEASEAERREIERDERAKRMEIIALVGIGIALWNTARSHGSMRPNKRRRGR